MNRLFSGSVPLRAQTGSSPAAVGPLPDCVKSRHEALAGAWMQLGLSAVNRDDSFALEQALHCFNQAIDLREPLLDEDDPATAYDLAGAWMNRGEALDRMGGQAHLDAALASYDCALALLSAFPAAATGRYRERWAIAHLNRGTTLLNRDERADREEAVKAFQAVLAMLDEGASETGADGLDRSSAALIGASARAHLADAFGRLKRWEPAQTSALAAMRGVAKRELLDPAAARIGLKARLALCACSADALVRMPERTGVSEGGALAEALEAAEDGIALAQRWPDDARLNALREELVRFCAQGYARRQPHLLTEFLQENLAASHPIATAARRTAIQGLVNAGIKSIAQSDLAPTLATLRGLRETAAAVPYQ